MTWRNPAASCSLEGAQRHAGLPCWPVTLVVQRSLGGSCLASPKPKQMNRAPPPTRRPQCVSFLLSRPAAQICCRAGRPSAFASLPCRRSLSPFQRHIRPLYCALPSTPASHTYSVLPVGLSCRQSREPLPICASKLLLTVCDDTAVAQWTGISGLACAIGNPGRSRWSGAVQCNRWTACCGQQEGRQRRPPARQSLDTNLALGLPVPETSSTSGTGMAHVLLLSCCQVHACVHKLLSWAL